MNSTSVCNWIKPLQCSKASVVWIQSKHRNTKRTQHSCGRLAEHSFTPLSRSPAISEAWINQSQAWWAVDFYEVKESRWNVYEPVISHHYYSCPSLCREKTLSVYRVHMKDGVGLNRNWSVPLSIKAPILIPLFLVAEEGDEEEG